MHILLNALWIKQDIYVYQQYAGLKNFIELESNIISAFINLINK